MPPLVHRSDFMKITKMFRTSMSLAALAMLSASPTTSPALTVGDPAPKIQVGKWVQGEPVKEFEREHVYIVEFWATWCGPCRVSIPHLNALHEKFKGKGVVVIGQDVWEDDEDKVVPFVKKMGKDMTYRVALDDKAQHEKGAMAETWMAAAAQNGIPTAFIVNQQGRIAWIGHPMELKEELLDQILTGKFDVAKFAKDFAREQAEQKRRMELSAKLSKAMRNKDWDAADASIAEMEKLMPESARDRFSMPRLQVLLGRGNYSSASKFAQTLSDTHSQDAQFLNGVAWTLVLHAELPQSELELAERIAERANKQAKEKDADILDTLARAQFRLGKKEQAIATQETAVKIAGKGNDAQLHKTLDAYKQGKLPPAS